MFSFNFLGKDSYADFGIHIERRPVIPKPQRNIEYIEVPGRSGSLKVDDESYKDIVIPVQCGFRNTNVASKAEEVKSWLDGGEGQLIFNNQPDRYYLAHVSEQMDIRQEFKILGKFVVNFRCRPFQYDTNNEVITLTLPGTVFNPGTLNSEPIINVTGSGDITLTINQVSIQLSEVNESITIDSCLKDAYKDTMLQNSKMNGDFPILKPGLNSITWTGAVSSVQIIPNWRYL